MEESYLRVNLPKAEWAFNLKSKFSGKLLVCWSELRHLTGNDYDVAKVRLVTQMGYTSRKAGLAFFGLTKAEFVNWDGDTLVSHGVLMCKRLCGLNNIPLKILCHFVRWWVYHLMPKNAKSFIDSWEVYSLDKLREVLRDYLGVEGSFKDYFKSGGGSNKEQ